MRSCLTQGCFIRSCSTHVRGPAQDSICIQEKALSGITIRWGRASPCSEKLFQGCFPSAKCIPLQEKTLPGMISFCEMHPPAEKSSPRDDFLLQKSSLRKSPLASLPPRHPLRKVLASLLYWSSPSFSTFMKASFGISTLPTICIRFFPSFCFSRSFFLREMSPP